MEPLTLPANGEVLGDRYRIDDRLGAGAMATVFLATDQTTEQQVAIKVLDPKVGEDDTLERRFENEAALGRSLNHPNTIKILDAGRMSSGLPYVVMELLTGRSLAEAAADGPFSPQRALQIGRQVLDSLSEAHDCDIIHRDIKPTNIMVEDQGDNGEVVKVLDFGIAKVLDESRVAHSIKTRTGVNLGSPTYMAPERLRTTGQPLTPSSDLYSVGIVMAELIKGEPLYGDLSPIQIFATQLEGLPAPLPESVAGTRLGAVLAKATSIPIEPRFQSAAEMRVAVERLLARPGRILEPSREAERAMTDRYEPHRRPGLPTGVKVALIALTVLVIALGVALVVT